MLVRTHCAARTSAADTMCIGRMCIGLVPVLWFAALREPGVRDARL